MTSVEMGVRGVGVEVGFKSWKSLMLQMGMRR